VQARCPHCGAATDVEPTAEQAKCASCGREFAPRPADATVLTGDVQDQSVTMEVVPDEAPEPEQEEPAQAICPGCGAAMPIDRTRSDIRCPGCGKVYPLLGQPTGGTGAPAPPPKSTADQATIMSQDQQSPPAAAVPEQAPPGATEDQATLMTHGQSAGGQVAGSGAAEGVEIEIVKDDGLQVKASAEGQDAVVPSAERPHDTTITQEGGIDWLREQLGEKYEVIDFLGRGGMGAVYKARQKNPSRIVAIKVMLGGALASEKARKRFEREAHAAAAVPHPSIVPVYEVGEVADQPFFTMEFVEGQDLGAYVRKSRLDRAGICKLMAEICLAVDFAHTRGVIHRDLKPGNIMVDNAGQARILDFGLARIAREDGPQMSMLTMSGDVMGTPRYMSPEQALGKPSEIDGRTDVYSLGVMFYELIVGMPPYNIDGVQGLRAYDMLMKTEPVRPTMVHPLMPYDLEAILLKTLEKDKRLRYRTALALAEDIQNFLADRPVTAQSATRTYRAKKYVWRNRRVIFPVLGGLIVLALVGGILGGLWLGTRGKEQETREKYEGLAGGVENMKAFVLQKGDDGQWMVAHEFALAAEEYWPDSEHTRGLVEALHEKAKDAVKGAIDQLNKDVRAQQYTSARGRAEALGALALRMPFDDVKRTAEHSGASFVEACWADLVTVLNDCHAYTREDSVAYLEKYLAEFGSGAHATEAQEKLARMKAVGDAFFLQARLQAVEREMAAYNWPVADKVLDGAASAVQKADVADKEDWLKKCGDQRARLDSVIWSDTIEDLSLVRTLTGHEGYVKCVAFRPGEKSPQLASASLDGTVRLWDCADGSVARSFELGERKARSVALSRDGGLLAAGCEDGSVHLWDLKENRYRTWETGNSSWVESIGFSPDGWFLVTGSPDAVILWDIREDTPTVVHEFEGAREPAVISPNGSLVGASLGKGAIGLWDLKSGKPKRPIDCESLAKSLAFSPDGRHIAAGCQDNTVYLWTVKGGEALPTLSGHLGDVNALAFAPGGRMLASGNAKSLKESKGANRVILWDMSGTAPKIMKIMRVQKKDKTDSGADEPPQEWDFSVFATAFSQGGTLLAVAGNSNEIRLLGIAPATPDE